MLPFQPVWVTVKIPEGGGKLSLMCLRFAQSGEAALSNISAPYPSVVAVAAGDGVLR
jgi:hypothetical protein